MDKDSIKLYNRMYSLINRMDRKLVNEAIQMNFDPTKKNQKGYNGDFKSLKPYVHFKKTIDAQNNNRMVLFITIGPLYNGHANIIARKYPQFTNVENNFVVIRKPLNKEDVTDKTSYDFNDDLISNDNSSNNDSFNDLFGDLGDDSFTINESDESFDDLFGNIGFDDLADTSSTFDTDDTANKGKKVNSRMFNFFKDVYAPMIEELKKLNTKANNGMFIYDAEYLDMISDPQWAYNLFLSTPSDEDRLATEKLSKDIESDIINALKNSSNWISTLETFFQKIDLKILCYGRVLSHRNRIAIRNKGLTYGLQPTYVLTPGQWQSRFNRLVKPGAKPYPYIADRSGIKSKKDEIDYLKRHGFDVDDSTFDRLGSMASKAGERDAKYNFGTVNGYDISDTELMKDANGNDLEDVYDTRMGITSNINGGLNALAQADYDAYTKQRDSEEEIERKEDKFDIATEEGQIRNFNEALLDFADGNTNVSLKSTDGVDNPLPIYLDNIINFVDEKVSAKFSNPNIIQPCVFVISFAVAMYSKGVESIRQFCQSRRINTGNPNDIVKQYSDTIIPIIHSMYEGMYHYLEKKFKSGMLNLDNNGVQDEKVQDTSNDAQINESIYTVEKLLEELAK